MGLSETFRKGAVNLVLLGIAGCSTAAAVDTPSFGPQLPDAGIAADAPVTEMGFAGPTVDGGDANPLTETAMAAPAAPGPAGKGALDPLIARYANAYGVPESLVHRVVKRESTYNPAARNGGHYGLMQLKPETARTMGYAGGAAGLYDAETNLKYGVKYLRGAWLLADGSEDRAVRLYSAGYYYEAKRRGMLEETGLR
ncbi:MAG: hypothetical protein Kow0026_05950 [Oricola sp.]